MPLTLSLTPKSNTTLGVRVQGGNFGGDVIGIQHEHAPAWRAALPDLLAWAGAAVHGHPPAGQSSVRP